MARLIEPLANPTTSAFGGQFGQDSASTNAGVCWVRAVVGPELWVPMDVPCGPYFVVDAERTPASLLRILPGIHPRGRGPCRILPAIARAARPRPCPRLPGFRETQSFLSAAATETKAAIPHSEIYRSSSRALGSPRRCSVAEA